MSAIGHHQLLMTPAAGGLSYAGTLALTPPGVIWQCDDASGLTAHDSSGNAKDGTYGSSANTYHKTSIVVSGNFAIGLADRIFMSTQVFDLATLGTGWSETCVIKPSVITSNAIMGLGDSAGYNTSPHYGSFVYIDASHHLTGAHFVPGVGTVQATGSTVLVAGTIYFIGFVVDITNNILRLTINGVLEASASLGGSAPETFNAYHHFGYCGNSAPNGVSLSNAGIYQGDAQYAAPIPVPLSVAQMLALYNAGH